MNNAKELITHQTNLVMKTAPFSSPLVNDFNYGRVFAKERTNDFSIIMKVIIASSFLFAVAVLIF